MAKAITYKEAALLNFSIGVIGLCVAIPGYLKDWNEYKICNNVAGFEMCQNRAYTLTEPQPRMRTHKRYFGTPFIKVLGIGLSVVSFPLAAYCASKQADNCEYQETLESIEKLTAVQSQIQEKQIDIELGGQAYEAMKAIEQADLITRFNNSFYTEVNIEDIEAQEQEEQKKLQQIQEYKQLEFAKKQEETPATPTPDELVVDQSKQISENAQAFLNYLVRNNYKSITVRDAVRNSKIVTKQEQMRELMQELHTAELGEFKDDTFTFIEESS